MTAVKACRLSFAPGTPETLVRIASDDLRYYRVIPFLAASRREGLRIEGLSDGVRAEPGVSHLEDASDVADLLRMDRELAVEVRVSVGGIPGSGVATSHREPPFGRAAVRSEANPALGQGVSDGGLGDLKVARDLL